MKDFQKLLKKKYFLGIFMCVMTISLAFSPVLAESEVQVKPETKLLHLETFTGHKTLKEGELIEVQLWIASETIDRANVTVFFPDNQLELKESLFCQDGVKKKKFSCEVILPRSNPMNFSFTGKKAGKFSLLIQVSGENTQTKQEITKRQQIQDIEVQAQVQWWSQVFSNSLFGVLFGGFLTIGTTVFTNWLQNKWAKRQRREWIEINLPAQLEVTRQAILQRRETSFELWMDKLRTEGYYTELQRFAKQQPNQENLAERLLKVAFDLRDYENEIKKFPLRELEEKYRNVAEELTKIISVLN